MQKPCASSSLINDCAGQKTDAHTWAVCARTTVQHIQDVSHHITHTHTHVTNTHTLKLNLQAEEFHGNASTKGLVCLLYLSVCLLYIKNRTVLLFINTYTFNICSLPFVSGIQEILKVIHQHPPPPPPHHHHHHLRDFHHHHINVCLIRPGTTWRV